MSKLATTTFLVSDVEPATTPLLEIPYKEAIEALMRTAIPAGRSRSVEGCARYHGHLIAGVPFHPVVAAAHRAFMKHHPLCLLPDTIWLMTIHGVANHINVHAEKLRSRFVSYEGRIRIEVRRDDFIKGSPENAWSEVFDEFSAQIRDHIGPEIDLFLPAFSTTGPVERAAADVVLLDAMQSYFEYVVLSECGIPTIILEGTQEDWKTLVERVQGFREFGLESWIDVLSPILDQFARASQGDVDQPFWRSIYKFNDQSGGPIITGWITAFFPYLKNCRTRRATVPSRILIQDKRNDLEVMLYPGDEPETGWASGPTMEQLPSGLSKAPFQWDYLERTFDMEFLGGFVGVAQDQETLTLRPEIGWAVREAPAAG
jgi:hypothetical protein